MPPEPIRHQLCILDTTGDTRVGWSPVIDAEVSEARSTFDRMRAKGYFAFRPDEAGKGTLLAEFDATAERIIMTPPAVGG